MIRNRLTVWLLICGLSAGPVVWLDVRADDLLQGKGANAAATGAARADMADLRVQPKRLKDYGLSGLDAKVNLESLEPWDVVELIEFLAYRGGLHNIVIGKGVAGLTTKLKFDDVTVGDALEVVLSVNNLAYQVKAGIVRIMTDEEYTRLHGAGFYDHKKVRIVDLKYGDANRVAGMLEPVKSSIGTVVADPLTATLILIDTPEKIREMRAIIERADMETISRVIPAETKPFVLQYAELEDIQKEVSAIVSKDVGRVSADARTKTLIVRDLPHNMRRIEELISLFDRRPKQVFIESKIVQVSLSDEYSMGIQWHHLFEGIDPRFSLQTDMRPSQVLDGYGRLTYATILGAGDLTAVLDALKRIGETKILSNPHVAVLDSQEATIKVVEDRPYAEAELESGSTNVVGEKIQFIEVGVSLSVTPRVSEDGFISMAIRPEVSTVEDYYAARYPVPVVRKSYAETSVMVKDGATIIIAGMIENRKAERDDSIPFLWRIPLLGLLFRSSSDLLQTRETIAFLTPRIITGDEPFLLARDLEKVPKPLRPVGAGRGKELKGVR